MKFISTSLVFSAIAIGMLANALNDDLDPGTTGNVKRQLPYNGGKASKGSKGKGKGSKSSKGGGKDHYYAKSAKGGYSHGKSSDDSSDSSDYKSFSNFRK